MIKPLEDEIDNLEEQDEHEGRDGLTALVTPGAERDIGLRVPKGYCSQEISPAEYEDISAPSIAALRKKFDSKWSIDSAYRVRVDEIVGKTLFVTMVDQSGEYFESEMSSEVIPEPYEGMTYLAVYVHNTSQQTRSIPGCMSSHEVVFLSEEPMKVSKSDR